MLVIGDVAGQGAEAAALTGLARYTLRGVGQLTGDPSRAAAAAQRDAARPAGAVAVHRRLRASARRRGPEGRVARMLLANAGHPPPLLVRDGGAGARRRIRRRWPARSTTGNGRARRSISSAATRCVLYTDGVIDTVGERRAASARSACSTALRGAPRRTRRRCSAASTPRSSAFQRGAQRDDTAMVAVRYVGAPVLAARRA